MSQNDARRLRQNNSSVYLNTVEAAYCDHFGTRAFW